MVISDTGFYEGNLPAITVGLRGLIYAQIDVTGAELDLHSGAFGGNVQNPANALATIIARLKNDDGSVAVPGFYDEVRELTSATTRSSRGCRSTRKRSRKQLGVPALFGEPGFLSLERKGARPTLDVNGIWGGFQGEGIKTIIPAHAHAKVSCRLVADMDPMRTFERVRDCVSRSRPPGVRRRRSAAQRRHVDADADRPSGDDRPPPHACEEVFGEEPLLPARGWLDPGRRHVRQRSSALPVVLLGFTNPDDQAHAPNEIMRLDNLRGRPAHDRALLAATERTFAVAPRRRALCWRGTSGPGPRRFGWCRPRTARC